MLDVENEHQLSAPTGKCPIYVGFDVPVPLSDPQGGKPKPCRRLLSFADKRKKRDLDNRDADGVGLVLVACEQQGRQGGGRACPTIRRYCRTVGGWQYESAEPRNRRMGGADMKCLENDGPRIKLGENETKTARVFLVSGLLYRASFLSPSLLYRQGYPHVCRVIDDPLKPGSLIALVAGDLSMPWDGQCRRADGQGRSCPLKE
jgi:hypothetical protein